MSKIIDLSKTIQYNANDPFFMKVKIKHKAHKKAKWLVRFLGLPFRLFPKKFIGWADDEIKKWVCTLQPILMRLGIMHQLAWENQQKLLMKFH